MGGQPDPHPVGSPNQTNLVAEQPDPAADPHRVGQSSLVAGQPLHDLVLIKKTQMRSSHSSRPCLRLAESGLAVEHLWITMMTGSWEPTDC